MIMAKSMFWPPLPDSVAVAAPMVRRWLSSSDGVTPYANSPYVIAATPPVRATFAVSTPARRRLWNLGTLFLKVFSLVFRTAACFCVPPAIPTPSDFTFLA